VPGADLMRDRLVRAGERVARSRLTLVAAALLAVYALAGLALAPGLIERYAPRLLEQRLGSPVGIGRVRVNPFLFTLTANDVVLGTAGAPVLALERLFVDFELASAYRRAWSFADVRLDGFALAVTLEPDGRSNVAGLVERLRGDDTRPLRPIFLEHAAARGTATLTERAPGTPDSVLVAPIDVEVHQVSTLPDRTGHYTATASLRDGGRIAWRGDLTMQPVASDGELSVTGLALPTIQTFAPHTLPLPPLDGTVGVDLRYRFAYADGKASLVLDDLRAQVDGLVVQAPEAGPPLLELATVRASGGRVDLERRAIEVEAVALERGVLRASVDQAGALDWLRLAHAPVPTSSRTAAEGAAWRVLADRIEVEDLALHYTDRSRTPAIAIDAQQLAASLKLEAETTNAGTEVVAGDVRIALRRAAFSTLDSDAPLVRLDAVAVTGGRLATATREVGARALSVNGGSAQLVVDERGRVELVDVLAPQRGGAIRREAEALAQRARVAGQPWRYSLGRASLADLQLDVALRGPATPIRYGVTVASAALAAIDAGTRTPMRFEAALSAEHGGKLDASGTIAQDFGGADLKVAADGVDLVPLQPLLAQHARLDLASGRASLSASVRFGADATPRLAADGTFTVADLRVNEAGTTERFLAWQRLDASKVALTLAPGGLSIGEIRTQAPEAKIAIDEQRHLNLAQVLRRDAPAPAGATERPARGATRFPLRVARVTLRGGIVDFSDRSLALPFSTRVRRLNGTVLGISSDPESRADIKVAGLIEDSGSASAEGAVTPSDPTAFTDIRADFNNVALPPLTPYAVTFAGRRIESGRLWLDLRYRIVDHRLTARNEIVLDEFKLGERVEAPSALDLPLDLAVALLTDENGRINVAVPIEGDLDSPHFDYGRLVREALANLVTRVVTAPFRFLQGLGGGGAELEAVHFEPGRAGLAPPERETLDRVAKALAERPQFKLVVHGPYDRERDGEALREQRVRRELARALGVELGPREDPGPVAYGDAATQRALERLLAARAGPDAADRLAASYAARTGKAPERVNPVFAVFGRASPDREFYEAVFRRLVESEPLDEAALNDLAARRAQAIVTYLLKTANLDAGRIEVGAVRAVDSKREPAVEAALGLELMRRS
jgi:hypothetical protein